MITVRWHRVWHEFQTKYVYIIISHKLKWGEKKSTLCNNSKKSCEVMQRFYIFAARIARCVFYPSIHPSIHRWTFFPNRILQYSSDWSWQFWTLTQPNVVSSQALINVSVEWSEKKINSNQLQIVFWNSSLRINGLIRHKELKEKQSVRYASARASR